MLHCPFKMKNKVKFWLFNSKKSFQILILFLLLDKNITKEKEWFTILMHKMNLNCSVVANEIFIVVYLPE